MKMFPESYRKHVTWLHIFFVTLSTIFLLISVTWMLIILIVGHDAFPKDIRLFFGRMIIISLPLSLMTITLVIYSIDSRLHKSQSEISREKRLENRLADRAAILQSLKYVKYHYPFRAQNDLALIIFFGGICEILLLVNEIYPLAVIIAVFIMCGTGAVWIVHRRKKDDFVNLTTEGISYCFSGETGLMPWTMVREIRLTKQGYLIQCDNGSLVIRREIEPVSAPRPNFIKSLTASSFSPNICGNLTR